MKFGHGPGHQTDISISIRGRPRSLLALAAGFLLSGCAATAPVAPPPSVSVANILEESPDYRAYPNVETLLDDVDAKVGQRVQVAGRVDEVVDPHTVVLESGGPLWDEVTVFIPFDPPDWVRRKFERGNVLQVEGTVTRDMSVEVERSLDRAPTPELRAEREKVRYYLVADKVVPIYSE